MILKNLDEKDREFVLGGWRKLTDNNIIEFRFKEILTRLNDQLTEAKEHEAEWREAHALLTGKFETGWCMIHPDGPTTELGKAILELKHELTEAKEEISDISFLISTNDFLQAESRALTAKLEKVEKILQAIKTGTSFPENGVQRAIRDRAREALAVIKGGCSKCGGSQPANESCSDPYKPPRHPKDNPKG